MKLTFLAHLSTITSLIGIWVVLTIILLTHNACVSGKSTTSIDRLIVFTDSAEASVKIVRDDIEKYFEHVTTIDMAIQMKKVLADSGHLVTRDHFTRFIRTQVSDWTDEEKKRIRQTMEEAFAILRKLNPACIPKVSLIKIKTNPYGQNVYYTRGPHICIPENIFSEYNSDVQLPILIHEIFHVISKYNPAYRDSLYALIGFEKLKKEPLIPEILQKKLLTNPDGVHRFHAIRLGEESNGDKSIWALPLITSKMLDFNPTMPQFFDYLAFDLYPIEFVHGEARVDADKLGQTKLPVALTTHFFTKIRDNTQYIIHPEEIMADNFMLAALAVHRNDFSRFSKPGKKLIEDVIRITREARFAR